MKAAEGIEQGPRGLETGRPGSDDQHTGVVGLRGADGGLGMRTGSVASARNAASGARRMRVDAVAPEAAGE